MAAGPIEREEFFRRLDAAYRQPGHLMQRKMALVGQVVRPGRRLLDAGCGTGEALVALAGRFERAVGLDAGYAAVRYARQKTGGANGVALVLGNAQEIGFETGVFDCCLLLDVLEHVERPRAVLSQVARVVRAGGQLVVTVPNWTDWITSGLLGMNPEHRTSHTPRGWRRLIEQAGFRACSCRAVRLPLLRSDFLARKMPYLGMCIVLVAERRVDG